MKKITRKYEKKTKMVLYKVFKMCYESEAKRDALYAQLEKEKEEIEKNNSSEGSDPTTWTCLETSPSVGGGVS